MIDHGPHTTIDLVDSKITHNARRGSAACVVRPRGFPCSAVIVKDMQAYFIINKLRCVEIFIRVADL